MFVRKSTKTEHPSTWATMLVTILQRMDERLEHLEAHAGDVKTAPTRSAHVQGPHHSSSVAEWLPVLDRMQELAMIALGHPDLAQQFGLTARQKEADHAAGPTTWTELDEQTPDGVTYG